MRGWMAGSGARAAPLGLLAIMLVSAAPASADVISVFDVSGTFDDGSTLAGTLDIDVTSGDATAISVVADGIRMTSVLGISANLIVANAKDTFGHLYLYFPVADLIGYDGGNLSTQSRLDKKPYGVSLVSGAVTLAPATAVPEASTWTMLLAGFAMLGVAGYCKAQRHRPQADCVGA
jgi:PEP-CTERM motif-containing protein